MSEFLPQAINSTLAALIATMFVLTAAFIAISTFDIATNMKDSNYKWIDRCMRIIIVTMGGCFLLACALLAVGFLLAPANSGGAL